MHLLRRSILEVIKCSSLIKNYRKQEWRKLNYEVGKRLQNRSAQYRLRYAKQKNISVFLFLRKIKKRCYENLNKGSIVDNKPFWKTLKPVLSHMVAGQDKIHLTENNELVKTNLEAAEVLNNFFPI